MREDIQCLRGVSITFVFLYHLLPHIFHNGYLGVDIFFVISGYLMARHLTISPVKSFFDIGKFYYKRFKRILPLYYLTISFTILGVHLFLGHFWWKNNQKYAISAMFCVTNQLVIHNELDYFEQTSGEGSFHNAFFHFWSLGVGIQFILICPLFFIFLQLLKTQYARLAAVSIVTGITCFLFTILNPKFGFNFVLLRFWQFTAGFIPVFLKEFEKEEETQKETSQGTIEFIPVAVSCLFLCLLPFQLDPLWLRPLITLITVFIIACESRNNQLFKSSQLAYLGDISYVIYLVHWPIITIFLGSTPDSYIFCTVSTLLISILLHHFFEKISSQFNVPVTISFLILLICLNCFLLHSVQKDSFWRTEYSDDVQKIIDENQKMLTYSWKVKSEEDNCTALDFNRIVIKHVLSSCNYTEGNGNSSVMLIGDRFVWSFEDMIKKKFNLKYSSFKYISMSGSFGFYDDPHVDFSQEGLEEMRKKVQIHNPDVLFILVKHSPIISSPIVHEDPLVKKMNETLEFYEKYVKKHIFILDVFPHLQKNFMKQFLSNVIQKPEDVEKLHISRKEEDVKMWNGKKRIQTAKCKKCQIVDLKSVFLEGNEKYLMFDRKEMLSFVDNDGQFTVHGIQKTEKIWEDLVEKVIG